jgi:hypothetical protein
LNVKIITRVSLQNCVERNCSQKVDNKSAL